MNTIKKTFALDILRGLAAFYVLVGHIKWLLWEGYSEGYKLHPEAYSFFGKILVYGFSAFSFGHEAVMLFFVLSGFVIHYSTYNQSLKTESFSIGTYLYKRIKRIYPPFLLALLLTWILDSIGRSSGYSIYSAATNFTSINANISSDLTWETLLGNISMLQTLFVSVWGSNGPLWSLMFEWWFYILYIPVFFINRRNPLATAFLIGGLFICSLFIPTHIYKWATVLNYFFAWYFGVIAADLYMNRIKGFKSITILLAYIIIVLGIGVRIIGAGMSDYFVALFFTGVMYLSLHFYKRLYYFQLLQPLSDCSYTLYVVHVPIIVLLSGWLQQRLGGALPIHFGYVFLGIVICLAFAWAAHFLVEKPFVRKKVENNSH